jgi:hypothetical protein
MKILLTLTEKADHSESLFIEGDLPSANQEDELKENVNKPIKNDQVAAVGPGKYLSSLMKTQTSQPDIKTDNMAHSLLPASTLKLKEVDDTFKKKNYGNVKGKKQGKKFYYAIL